jgi:hypothetical protein
MADFKIGINHADLDYLANQFAKYKSVPMSDPYIDPIEYAGMATLGDGTVRSIGWLQQNWQWAFMSEAQCETLRGYIGAVNVLTRNNAGTMTEFTGVLLWPEREPEHRAGRVLDVVVRIIQMVVV